MLPGVSAEDCLFADLGLDPAPHGCQSFEATDFLLSDRRIDTRSSLILWQIGLTGHFDFRVTYSRRGLQLLTGRLQQLYTPDHVVILYEAPVYAICRPTVALVALRALSDDPRVTPHSTLYIPPLSQATPEPEMLDRLRAALTDVAISPSTDTGTH
jgi:hypothetical protein